MLWCAFDHMSKKDVKTVTNIIVSQPGLDVMQVPFFTGSYVTYSEPLLDFYKDQYLFDRKKNWHMFVDKLKKVLEFVFGPY